MDFMTQRNRPPRKGEVNSGETLVDTSGYIPPERQIFDMINAGRRLSENRKGMYEFERDDVVPEDFVDPTREPGFDLVDAGNIADSLTAKKRVVDAAKEKKASEDARKALRAEINAEAEREAANKVAEASKPKASQ